MAVGGGRLDVLWEHTTGNLRYISVLDGSRGRGWYLLPLAPVGRLYALYLRSDGLSSGWWYLLPHTTNKDCLGVQSV